MKAWLVRHPRFNLHFTLTPSSWMNLAERFFRDVTEDVVGPGSFTSTRQLAETIFAYLNERNPAPRRYVWKKSAQEVLASMQRARAVLAAEQAQK